MFRFVRCVLALIATVAAVPGVAQAEPVAVEYLGLQVVGNLEIAAEKSLATDGAVLLVHGSAAHHGVQPIADLQTNLKTRGVNSLAITLSLGLPQRRGMFDCKLESDHRHADAADEIVAWVEWLQKRGATRVVLLGHSRGGAQAVLAVIERPDAGVQGLVLAAPLVQSDALIAARYAEAFGAQLAPLLSMARSKVENGEGDTLLEVPGFLHCRRAKVTAAAFHDYYVPDPHHDVLALVGQADIPALIVVAGDDKVVPELPEMLAAVQTAGGLPPKLEVVTIAGADHMFRDLFGEDLADKTAEFFAAK